MVNPDADSYAKTLNHRKIIGKTQITQPTENQTNTKTAISLKVAVQFSHLDCQAGISPLYLLSTTSLATIYWFCILLSCNNIPDGGV